MRILLNGHVVAQAPSGPGAFHRVARELLDRGHEITFVGKRGYVYPSELLAEYTNFRFVDATNHWTDSLGRRSRKLVGAAALPLQILNHKRYMAAVTEAMRAEHQRRPCDAALFLDVPAFGRIDGLRVVSFPQGAPGSDVRSIQRHRQLLQRTEGRLRTNLLSLYGAFRMSPLGLPDFSASDHTIVASQGAKELLVSSHGVPQDKISVMPLPVGLDDLPQRDEPGPSTEPLELLWLGRIVPRKRLDLFLAGCALAIQQGVPLSIRVVGKFTFTPGLKSLLNEFRFPECLNYSAGVGRAEVGELLVTCDVLAQPSDDEVFGTSVAEAQACGTPVIVGATNGTGEYICERSIQLADDQPESFAAACGELYQRKVAGTLIRAAYTRDHALRTLAVEGVTDAIERLLRGQPADWEPASAQPESDRRREVEARSVVD